VIRKRLYNALPKPQYRSVLIAGWQNVNNIINAIKYQHKYNLADAKKIAHYFKGSSEKDSAQKVFNFLRNEIQYRVESADKQTTKSLPRFLADGEGDCKHYALFTCTILNSLGYRCVYRFAGYKGKGISHVYAYLPNSDIIVDAVLPYFNTEKTPTIKKDIDMSLYRLSGFDEGYAQDEVGGLNFSKVKDGIKKASAKASNVVQKAVKDVPAIAKKVAQGTKTMTLAVPRTAFIGLVKINVHGLATSLKKVMDAKGMDGLKWWYDFGGDRTALMNAIKDGSTKKRILGVEEEDDSYNEIFGGYSGGVNPASVGEPVTIASAIASATPILIKVKDVLAKSGIDVNEVSKAVTKGKETFQAVTGKKVEDVIFKKDSGVTSTKTALDKNDLKPTTQEDATRVATSSIAFATGQPIETIKEMVNVQQAKTPLIAPTFVPQMDKPSPREPFVPKGNEPVAFRPWYLQPTGIIAIVGGALLVMQLTKK
jgi:hypothetical protein